MFQNEMIATDHAEAAADKAMQDGMPEDKAIELYDLTYAMKLTELDEWCRNNVGLD